MKNDVENNVSIVYDFRVRANKPGRFHEFSTAFLNSLFFARSAARRFVFFCPLRRGRNGKRERKKE